MRAVLTITVDYSEGSTAAEIKEQLSQVALQAAKQNLFSGKLMASVDAINERVDFLEPAVAEYLNNGGIHCPFCGSMDTESVSRFDVDGPVGTMEVKCNECESTWEDVYRLVAYRGKELPI